MHHHRSGMCKKWSADGGAGRELFRDADVAERSRDANVRERSRSDVGDGGFRASARVERRLHVLDAPRDRAARTRELPHLQHEARAEAREVSVA